MDILRKYYALVILNNFKTKAMKTILLQFCVFFFSTFSIFGQWHIEYLSDNKTGLAATSTQDKAYFAGGTTYSGNSSVNVDIYNKNEGTWSTTQLSVGRTWLAAASGNGKVLFAGGEVDSLFSPINISGIVDIYDEKTDQWTTDTLSEPRVFLTSVIAGNKIMFCGGLTEVNWETFEYVSSNKVDIYDLNTGEWSVDTLSQPRAFIAGAANGDLAFLAGGWVSTGSVSDVVDIYNASTDSWSTATLSVPRAQAAGASVGKLVLIGGGGSADPHTPTDIVDIYDLETSEWSTASLSVARGELRAATVDDKVFFVGGSTIDQTTLYNGMDYFTEIDIYNNSTGEWSTDFLQNSRVNHAVTSLDNKLFVGGGNNLSGILDNVEVLDVSALGKNEINSPRLSFLVHPNPAKGDFTVRISSRNSANFNICLLDIQGHTVYQNNVKSKIRHVEIIKNNFAKGVYFLTVNNGDEQIVKKLVVN